MVCKIKTLDKPIVYIVDSDHKLLETLSRRLRLHKVDVEVFDSAEAFLNKKLETRAACLIIEVNLPNMGGIALLEHHNSLGVELPTIILSSGAKIPDAVRAMQAEAIDFIEKPFVENTLLEKILAVIEQA